MSPLELTARTTLEDDTFMLLMSEDRDRSANILRVLQGLETCRIVTFREALRVHPAHLLIICHVTGADEDAMVSLREAIDRHRLSKHVPLLFAIPSGLQKGVAVAVQFGADDIVSDDLDRDGLRQAIRDVRAKVRARYVPTHLPGRTGSSEMNRAGQALKSIFDAAGGGAKITETVLSDGAEAVVQMTRLIDIRTWINLIRTHDNATYQHCLLVAGLVADFSRRLSLTLTQQHALAQAALLHDIGKVGIPLAILNKPTSLSAGEKAIMDQHPVIGHGILMRQGFGDKQALSIVRHHHEFLDGSGYPDKLIGTQISELVRITTICDIFAALVERRIYKAPLTPEAAISNLDELGSKLDTGLLGDFRKVAQAMAA